MLNVTELTRGRTLTTKSDSLVPKSKLLTRMLECFSDKQIGAGLLLFKVSYWNHKNSKGEVKPTKFSLPFQLNSFYSLSPTSLKFLTISPLCPPSKIFAQILLQPKGDSITGVWILTPIGAFNFP